MMRVHLEGMQGMTIAEKAMEAARKKAHKKIKCERLLAVLLKSGSKKRSAAGSGSEDAGSDSESDAEVIQKKKKKKKTETVRKPKTGKSDEVVPGIWRSHITDAAKYGLKGSALKVKPGHALDSEARVSSQACYLCKGAHKFWNCDKKYGSGDDTIWPPRCLSKKGLLTADGTITKKAKDAAKKP